MKYTAKILGIGAQACDFRDENMLIFWGSAQAEAWKTTAYS